MKIPIPKLNTDKIFIIFKLSNPKFFKTIISFCSINFINANWAVIKNMKGNISNITDGIFKNVKNIGSVIETSISLKKLTSSNIFNINANDKKTKDVLSKVDAKTLLKYI